MNLDDNAAVAEAERIVRQAEQHHAFHDPNTPPGRTYYGPDGVTPIRSYKTVDNGDGTTTMHIMTLYGWRELPETKANNGRRPQQPPIPAEPSAPRDTTPNKGATDMSPLRGRDTGTKARPGMNLNQRWDQFFSWWDELWKWPQTPTNGKPERVNSERVTQKLAEQKTAEKPKTPQGKPSDRTRPPRPPSRRPPARTEPTPLPNPNERNGLSWPRPRAKAQT